MFPFFSVCTKVLGEDEKWRNEAAPQLIGYLPVFDFQ